MKMAGFLGSQKDGILLFKDVWQRSETFVARLEAGLSDSTHETFRWRQALVGDQQVMKDYRDCSDFKMRQSDLPVPPEFLDLQLLYEEVVGGVRECIKAYSDIYNLQLNYEEATNFVRYREGQHFATHPDSGFSYTCCVSAIGYLNDDYAGGEYVMPYKQLEFRPQRGDVLIHPSDFIYAHASRPVLSGAKYAAVTMYDYNDRNHQR
jgi:hypothetical protein